MAKASFSRLAASLYLFWSLNYWGFSPEARRGSQGASRAAPGKSGLHARGEGERVLALESREGTRSDMHSIASQTVELKAEGGTGLQGQTSPHEG